MVSFIIPIYNTKKELVSRCIRSILDQSYKDIEIIVVFNGCSENYSSEIKREFIGNRMIAFYDIEEKGVSNARNYGLKLAKGEFIAFCDADDFYLDRFVEEAVYLIQQYNLDIVSGGIILQYPEMKKSMALKNRDLLMIDCDTIRRHLLFPNGNMDAAELKGYNFSSPCAKLYKRALIGDTIFNNKIFHREDMAFNFEIVSKTNKIGIVNNEWYVYCQYSGSAVRSLDYRLVNNNIELVKTIHDMIFNKVPSNNLAYMYSYFFYRNIIGSATYSNSFFSWRKQIREIMSCSAYYDFTKYVDVSMCGMKKKHLLVIFLFNKKLFLPVYILMNINHKKIDSVVMFIE